MKKKILFCILLLSLVLTGCKTRKNQVAYTVYPIGYILNRLSTEQVQVVSIQNSEIIQRATIKEDFKNILELSEILFHIGSVEPYLTVYNNSIAELNVNKKDLSSMNAIYKFQRYTPVIVGGEISFVEAPYYRSDSFNDIDVNERDLYLWTDPISMLSMSKDVKNWLVKTYPESKTVFEDKFTSLEHDLVQLDAEFQNLASSLVSENNEIKFASITPTYGSWQKTYGIQTYPIVLSKYGVLPTETQYEAIKERLVADNVKYIVFEANMPDDMKELFNRIQSELSLEIVYMSDLSSLSIEQEENNTDYISLMYENLASLKTMITSKEEDVIVPIEDQSENKEQTENKTNDSE
ncbi:MAG: metal ABC transporter substrate-binding protein [Anaerorhabdus sp.]